MMSTLATAVATHPVVYGWWPGPWFLFIPLFWIGFVIVLLLLGNARRRRWAAAGYGPCGPWAGPYEGTSSATSVLAERYARGEIDETEYRARLEVLLASDAPRG